MGCSQLFEISVRFWEMALEIVEERRDAPEEHAGIPVIVAVGIFLANGKRGLFREATNCEDREAYESSGLRPCVRS